MLALARNATIPCLLSPTRRQGRSKFEEVDCGARTTGGRALPAAIAPRESEGRCRSMLVATAAAAAAANTAAAAVVVVVEWREGKAACGPEVSARGDAAAHGIVKSMAICDDMHEGNRQQEHHKDTK